MVAPHVFPYDGHFAAVGATAPIFRETEQVDILGEGRFLLGLLGVEDVFQCFVGHATANDLSSVGQGLGLSEGLSKTTLRPSASFAVFPPGRIETGGGGQGETEEDERLVVGVCHMTTIVQLYSFKCE